MKEEEAENKKAVEGELPPLSPEEAQQEERLRQIRERMKQKRSGLLPWCVCWEEMGVVVEGECLFYRVILVVAV